MMLAAIAMLLTVSLSAQKTYVDSLNEYLGKYVQEHEVVQGDDKQQFRFFPVDDHYRVPATFTRADNAKWFTMETSGTIKKTFRLYGVLQFTINATPLQLNLYQSQSLMQTAEYKDLLFLPFTDNNSGVETYEAGRYIDLKMGDIVNGKLLLDFNKAYNPYCAYVSGKYNCPIPPKENNLPVAINAGEKIFAKNH